MLDYFTGIGSVPWRALQPGRRGVGIELKASYYRLVCQFLSGFEFSADAADDVSRIGGRLMYRVIDTTALAARARYDRGLQYSTPVALLVRDAVGRCYHATYVDHCCWRSAVSSHRRRRVCAVPERRTRAGRRG